MFRKAKDSVAGTARFIYLTLFTVIFGIAGTAQDSCPGFPVMKQKKVLNVNITNVPVHGYLEYLPAGYDANPTKKYPLYVFFHGAFDAGDGSSDALCARLLPQPWYGIPTTQVEGGWWPNTVADQNNTQYSFILISPQFEYFDNDPNTINRLLDYIVQKYRVDLSRIYLTGISAGANVILNYAGSSVANATRVAAILPVSPCTSLSGTQATNIANAGLHVWTSKCGTSDDVCGGTDQAIQIANAINSVKPNLAWQTTFPVPGYPCNTSLTHNTWSYLYDVNFKQTVFGRNVNSFEWMVQYSRAANGPLPVTLKDFTARLSDGKVYLRWTTDAEAGSKRFGIERAGPNQQFTELAGIPAAGNSTTSKTYEWIDENPLTNLNFYRLSQTDADGQKQYFPIKKILNRVKWDRTVIASPNPFTTDIAVYLNVEKTQRVIISLNDMSGKRLKVVYGMYKEGAAEVNIAAGNLPRGIYLLKVEGESFSETQKVVKQ